MKVLCTGRYRCLFQGEREMFLVFSVQSYVIHFHFPTLYMAQKVGVVAIHQVWEIDNFARFFISEVMQMSRKHHLDVHLIQLGNDGFLHVIWSVPVFERWWHVRNGHYGIASQRACGLQLA